MGHGATEFLPDGILWCEAVGEKKRASGSKVKIPSIRELFNEPEEWHALWCGFFEILCPLPSRQPMDSEYYSKVIKPEYHYYRGGMGMAVLFWIVLAKLIQMVFW